MNSIEQVERLIQRLPTIACGTTSAMAFWQRVDGAMELVWDCVNTDAERTETEVRYLDLVEMANRLGVPYPDADAPRGTQKGQPLNQPTPGAGGGSHVGASIP